MTTRTREIAHCLLVILGVGCAACETAPQENYTFCVEDTQLGSVPATGAIQMEHDGIAIGNFERIGVQHDPGEDDVGVAVGACAAEGDTLWRLRVAWRFPTGADLPVSVERGGVDTNFSAYLVRCEEEKCLRGNEHVLQDVDGATNFTARAVEYDGERGHFEGTATITNYDGEITEVEMSVDW